MINLTTISMKFQKKVILNQISLKLKLGAKNAIVGHTGSGKTTLALIICGLLKPSTGTVTISSDNREICSPFEIRTFAQQRMIFQDAEGALNPGMKVSNQLLEVASKFRHERNEETKLQCLEMFDSLKLTRRAWSSYPTSLSYGQNARLNVIRALLSRPRLIVADEPFAGTDIGTKELLTQLLKNQAKKYDIGLILITHDFTVLSKLVDQVYVMKEGQIDSKYDVAKFLENNNISKAAAELLDGWKLLARNNPGRNMKREIALPETPNSP